MRRRPPPAFQFYASDWLGSTRIALMTPTQEGAYLRLLCHAWADEHCSLPDDDESLALLSRLSRDWIAQKAKILACFEPHPDLPGRLINRKLVEIREAQQAYADRQRTAGKRGAEQRWGRHGAAKGERMASPTRPNDNPTILPPRDSMATDSSPTLSPSPSLSPDRGAGAVSKRGPSPSVARRTWLTPFADDWAQEMGGEMPMGPAASVLRPLVDQHGEATVRAHLQRFLRAHKGAEARFLSLQKFGQTFGAWAISGDVVAGELRRPQTAAEVSLANVRKVLAEVSQP